MTIYTNADGLTQKYGTAEARSNQQGGFLCSYGPVSSLVLNMDLTRLDATEAIQNDVLTIPKNALIESVEVLTIEAATTGTAIDVGLIANDRDTSTDLNATVTAAAPTGLLDTFVTATMSEQGEYHKFWAVTAIPDGITTQGALVGHIMTVPTLITASITATAYDTGLIQLRVNFVPEALTGFSLVH